MPKQTTTNLNQGGPGLKARESERRMQSNLDSSRKSLNTLESKFEELNKNIINLNQVVTQLRNVELIQVGHDMKSAKEDKSFYMDRLQHDKESEKAADKSGDHLVEATARQEAGLRDISKRISLLHSFMAGDSVKRTKERLSISSKEHTEQLKKHRSIGMAQMNFMKEHGISNIAGLRNVMKDGKRKFSEDDVLRLRNEWDDITRKKKQDRDFSTLRDASLDKRSKYSHQGLSPQLFDRLAAKYSDSDDQKKLYQLFGRSTTAVMDGGKGFKGLGGSNLDCDPCDPLKNIDKNVGDILDLMKGNVLADKEKAREAKKALKLLEDKRHKQLGHTPALPAPEGGSGGLKGGAALLGSTVLLDRVKKHRNTQRGKAKSRAEKKVLAKREAERIAKEKAEKKARQKAEKEKAIEKKKQDRIKEQERKRKEAEEKKAREKKAAEEKKKKEKEAKEKREKEKKEKEKQAKEKKEKQTKEKQAKENKAKSQKNVKTPEGDKPVKTKSATPNPKKAASPSVIKSWIKKHLKSLSPSAYKNAKNIIKLRHYGKLRALLAAGGPAGWVALGLSFLAEAVLVSYAEEAIAEIEAERGPEPTADDITASDWGEGDTNPSAESGAIVTGTRGRSRPRSMADGVDAATANMKVVQSQPSVQGEGKESSKGATVIKDSNNTSNTSTTNVYAIPISPPVDGSNGGWNQMDPGI